MPVLLNGNRLVVDGLGDLVSLLAGNSLVVAGLYQFPCILSLFAVIVRLDLVAYGLVQRRHRLGALLGFFLSFLNCFQLIFLGFQRLFRNLLLVCFNLRNGRINVGDLLVCGLRNF